MVRFMSILAMLLFAALSPLRAQIFIENNDEELSPRSTSAGEEFIVVPEQGVTIDQYQYNYTPAGSGILVLSFLAGAYAFAKRKRD